MTILGHLVPIGSLELKLKEMYDHRDTTAMLCGLCVADHDLSQVFKMDCHSVTRLLFSSNAGRM
jgi:hypothetical protein